MNVFACNNYRAYLAFRAKREWGEITRLAKAAQCQQSYLSRALKGDVLLTPDQLHSLCEYWRLSEEESEFLLLLLEKARAATPAYRARLDRKLERIAREQENLEKRLETPTFSDTEMGLLYYSSWYWAAIHVCTSVPTLRTETALAQTLHLNPRIVRQVLTQLEKWNLIKSVGPHWVHASSNLHLPKKSPLIGQHHRQWREKAVEDSILPGENGVHYTQVQAMDESAFREIKSILLNSIDQTLEIADASESEKVVAVNIDAFSVT